MLYHKTGLPEEGDLVVCTVTKVYPNSIFVNIDEYGKSGMIHISEVAPGRIRNIRDYVSEGRVVVCKVLGIHAEKGNIDLSLRRVSEVARREKLEMMKKEQMAEKIVELLANYLKKDVKLLYDEISKKVFENYEFLIDFFQDVAAGRALISDFVPNRYAKDLEDLIKKRIRIEKIKISGTLKLSSYAPNGVEVIKEALKRSSGKDIEIKYLGAGSYKISVTAADFKTAEKILNNATTQAIEYVEKNEGVGSFIRDKEQ